MIFFFFFWEGSYFQHGKSVVLKTGKLPVIDLWFKITLSVNLDVGPNSLSLHILNLYLIIFLFSVLGIMLYSFWFSFIIHYWLHYNKNCVVGLTAKAFHCWPNFKRNFVIKKANYYFSSWIIILIKHTVCILCTLELSLIFLKLKYKRKGDTNSVGLV